MYLIIPFLLRLPLARIRLFHALANNAVRLNARKTFSVTRSIIAQMETHVVHTVVPSTVVRSMMQVAVLMAFIAVLRITQSVM